MSIKHIIYYAVKRLKSDLLIQFFVLIGMTLAVLFCETCIFISQSVLNDKKEIDNCLSEKAEKYGGLEMVGNFQFDEFSKFYEELIDEGIIKKIGSQSDLMMYSEPGQGSTSLWEKMVDKQKKGPLPLDSMDYYEGFMGLCINSGEFDMYDLKLLSGSEPNEWEITENRTLIYLGANFDFVPVGTVFEWSTESEKMESIVAGIFEKGCDLLDESKLFNSIYEGVDSGVASTISWNMDNLLVEVNDSKGIICSMCMFQTNDDQSFDFTKEQIEKKAEDKGVSVHILSLKDRIDVITENSLELYNAYKKMAFFIIATVFVINITSGILGSVLRKNEIAVWRVNGFTVKDVFEVIFIENLFIAFLACIAAPFVMYFLELKSYTGHDLKMVEYALIKSILGGFIIAIAISAAEAYGIVKTNIKKNVLHDIREIRR